jgi:hypothetical protein
VVQVVPLKVCPWVPTLDGTTLWVSARDDGVIVRVDLLTVQVVSMICVTVPAMIAVGHGAVWVTSGSENLGWTVKPGAALTRINPETNTVAAVIPIVGGTVGVAVDDTYV